jgi:hypothetical protein
MRGRANNYTAEELAWLRGNCAFTTKDLGRYFRMFFSGRDDVTDDALRNACQARGWLTGRNGCFAKGTVPPNKGRKGWHPPGCEKGWFPKGHRSINHRGPGHEYIDKKDGYVWLIVAGPPPWPSSTSKSCHPRVKHRYLWEQANGPIPKGHVLKCMGGDKTNCDPSNWRLIPQAILPRLAGRWTLAFDAAPPELKESLLAAALLQYEAKKARRKVGLLTPQERFADRRRAQREVLCA